MKSLWHNDIDTIQSIRNYKGINTVSFRFHTNSLPNRKEQNYGNVKPRCHANSNYEKWDNS